jgi:glycosyltransferase involved in cell wall biosynthesis
LIIIDDASTRSIGTVIDKFNDSRIILTRNSKNCGVSYSRNRGIMMARHDNIALLDSDDEWLPDKLKKQMQYFIDNPGLRVVHTEEIWIRNGVRVNQMKKHQKSGGDIFIRSLDLCLMSPSSIMIKRSVFNDYGVFDEELPVCEDYDLWLKISANEEVGFIKEPQIVKYGGHEDQLSRRYRAMDKFRVKSLVNIMENIELSHAKQQALKEVILKKSKILINGAIKRNLKSEAAAYSRIIKKYSDL